MTRLRTIALIAMTVAAAGCGDGGSGAESIHGTYVLRNVNGLELPFTRFSAGSESIVVLDGTVTLEANGSFTRATTERSTSSQGTTTTTRTCGGTYEQGGPDLVFTETSGEGCGGTRTGSLVGSNLIVNVGGSAYGYRK
jgi:hypothetical protein